MANKCTDNALQRTWRKAKVMHGIHFHGYTPLNVNLTALVHKKKKHCSMHSILCQLVKRLGLWRWALHHIS